ncbi:unnamed protein product [Urochloa humidicola]
MHTDNPAHVLGTHVDHVHDIELQLDKGGHFMRKFLLDGRIFPKMHLDFQCLLKAMDVVLIMNVNPRKLRDVMSAGLEVMVPFSGSGADQPCPLL